MKKVDIRVIGRLEIDMNTLTDKARNRVDQLLLAHAILLDEREYWWRNTSVFSDERNIKMSENSIKKEQVEIELYDIINDYKSKKFHFFKLLDGLNTRKADLIFSVLYGFGYVSSCISQDIIGAMCFGYLTWHSAYNYNAKIDYKEVM